MPCRLLAEDDILSDGIGRHQHEVLVDHTYAAVDGVLCTAERDGPATNAYGTLVRSGKPIQNTHEGSFSGAVFAHEGVGTTSA